MMFELALAAEGGTAGCAGKVAAVGLFRTGAGGSAKTSGFVSDFALVAAGFFMALPPFEVASFVVGAPSCGG